MNNLNRTITCKKIEAVIKAFQTKKPKTGGFKSRILPELQRRANTYTPQIVLHKRERTLSNSFYEAIVTLILKSHTDSTKRETNFPHKY